MHDMNKETKTITKKLRSGNLDFFLNTYDRMKDEGWTKAARGVNDGTTLRVTMEKEVNIDSTEPERSETNCRPLIYKPEEMVLSINGTEISGVSETDEVVVEELKREGCMELNKIATVLQEDLIQDTETIRAVLLEGENKETSVNMTAQVEEAPETPVEVETTYEKRPYTVDELSSWGWTELTKLGGVLGAGIGTRDKRQASIAALSLAQWGASDE